MKAFSDDDLLAAVLGGGHRIVVAREALSRATLPEIFKMSRDELAKLFEDERDVYDIIMIQHLLQRIADNGCVRDPSSAAEYLMKLIGNKEREHFVVLFLNTRNEIIGHEIMYVGTVMSTTVRIAEVFGEALRRNMPRIIVGHNHPSGNLTPSSEDVALTKRLVDFGKNIDLEILDHIIVSERGFASLREMGLGYSNWHIA